MGRSRQTEARKAEAQTEVAPAAACRRIQAVWRGALVRRRLARLQVPDEDTEGYDPVAVEFDEERYLQWVDAGAVLARVMAELGPPKPGSEPASGPTASWASDPHTNETAINRTLDPPSGPQVPSSPGVPGSAWSDLCRPERPDAASSSVDRPANVGASGRGACPRPQVAGEWGDVAGRIGARNRRRALQSRQRARLEQELPPERRIATLQQRLKQRMADPQPGGPQEHQVSPVVPPTPPSPELDLQSVSSGDSAADFFPTRPQTGPCARAQAPTLETRASSAPSSFPRRSSPSSAARRAQAFCGTPTTLPPLISSPNSQPTIRTVRNNAAHAVAKPPPPPRSLAWGGHRGDSDGVLGALFSRPLQGSQQPPKPFPPPPNASHTPKPTASLPRLLDDSGPLGVCSRRLTGVSLADRSPP